MVGHESSGHRKPSRGPAVFRIILLTALTIFGPPTVYGAGPEESSQAPPQEPLFDWHQNIRSTPVLSALAGAALGRYGQDGNAYRYWAAVDWHSVIRLGSEMTRFPQAHQDGIPVQALGDVRGEFRLPLRNWTLALGLGWSWERGFENHSGPSSGFGVEYRIMDFVRLDAESDRALIDLRVHSDSRVGFSIVFSHAEARIGYRWLILGPRTLSGPELGLTARF